MVDLRCSVLTHGGKPGRAAGILQASGPGVGGHPVYPSMTLQAAGTQDAFNAIQTDPQLANRFEPILLRRWAMGEDYLRLLASFEVALPLEQRSGLVEPALALKILSLSEGTIGEISALLCRAALEAIERGTEQITGASLERCGYVAPSERRRAAISAY